MHRSCVVFSLFLPLIALVGCHPTSHPDFRGAPTMPVTATQVAYGDTIQWYPNGKPFQIYWQGANPCIPELIRSNGKDVATCYVLNSPMNKNSVYYYDIDVPDLPAGKTANQMGVHALNTGPCKSCSIGIELVAQAALKVSAAKQTQAKTLPSPITVSCDGTSGATTKVNPPAAAGFKAGDNIVFRFSGVLPTETDSMIEVIFTNVPEPCSSDLSTPNATVACKALTTNGQPVAYTVTAGDCSAITTPTITVQ